MSVSGDTSMPSALQSVRCWYSFSARSPPPPFRNVLALHSHKRLRHCLSLQSVRIPGGRVIRATLRCE